MGVFLYLDLIPGRIDKQAWADVYEESLKLIGAYPFASLTYNEIDGCQRFIYSSSVEYKKDDPQGRHWQVVGDLVSKKTAEPFELYYDLDYYLVRCNRKTEDILLDLAREQPAGSVFCNETEYLDYHFPLLAIAMLIETRFPYYAVVGGDLSLGDAQRAKRWAEPILGYPLAIPVLLDPDKAVERLQAGFSKNEALEKARDLCIDLTEPGFVATVLKYAEPAYAEKWFLGKLSFYSLTSMLREWLRIKPDLDKLLCLLTELDLKPTNLFEELFGTGVFCPPEVFNRLANIYDLNFDERFVVDYYLEQDSALAVLERYFPWDAAKLEERFEAESTKFIDSLVSYKETIQWYNRFTGMILAHDDEIYLNYTDKTQLNVEQQQMLDSVFAVVKGNYKRIRDKRLFNLGAAISFGITDNLKCI